MQSKVKRKLVSASILGVSLAGISSLAVACSNPVQESKDNALNELKVDKIYNFVTPEAKEETTKLIMGAASVAKVDQYLNELKTKATSNKQKADEMTAYVKNNTFKVFNKQLDSSIDLKVDSISTYDSIQNQLLNWYKNVITQAVTSDKYLETETKNNLKSNSDKTKEIKTLFDIFDQYKSESNKSFNKLLASKKANYISEINKLRNRLSTTEYNKFAAQVNECNDLEAAPYDAILKAAKEANFANLRNEILEFINHNQAREFTASLRDSLDNKVKEIAKYSAENLATLEKLQKEAQVSVANQLFEIYSKEIKDSLRNYTEEMKQKLLAHLTEVKANYNEIEEFQSVMQEARNINALYGILAAKEKFPYLNDQDITEFKNDILHTALSREEQLEQMLRSIQSKDLSRYQELAKKQVANSFEYISAENITRYSQSIDSASNKAYVKEILAQAAKDNLESAHSSLQALINNYSSQINILKTKALDMLANIAIQPNLEQFNQFSTNQIHTLSEINIFVTSKLPNLVFFDQPTVLNLLNALNGIEVSTSYADAHKKFETILTEYRTKYLTFAKNDLKTYLATNENKIKPEAKVGLDQKIDQTTQVNDFIDAVTYYDTVKNDINRAIYDKYLEDLTNSFEALEDSEKATYKAHLLELLNKNQINEFATYLMSTIEPQNQINQATVNNLKMQYKSEIEAYDYLKIVNPAKIAEYTAKIEDPKLVKPSMVKEAMQKVEASYFNNFAPFAKGNVTIKVNDATFTINNGILISASNLQSGDYVLPQVWKVEADAFESAVEYGSGNYSFALPNLREVNGTPFKFAGLKSINLGHINIIPANAFQDITSLNTIIAPEVTEINSNAFDNTRITTIVAPKLKTVGSKAFANNPSLSSIKIPTVTSLPNDVFANDTGLRSVSLPSLKTISAGERNSTLFQNNTSLVSVELPVLENVPDRLFANIKTLKSVSLPEAKSIGDEAFKSSNVTNLIIPKVTTVGNNAFESSALATISAPELVSVGKQAFYNTELVSLNLPKLATAGKEAFAANNLLRTINLDALETIPTGAFARNKVIDQITLKAASRMDNVSEGDLAAFQELSTLTQLNIPNLINISDKAFFKSQSNVTISASKLENIGERAFQDSKVKAIIAPKLKTIGNYAFKNAALTSLDFSSVESIGTGSFINSLLSEVTANKVTTLGEFAFAGSKNLINVAMNELATMEAGTFANNPLLQSISFEKLTKINDAKSNSDFGQNSFGAFDTDKSLSSISLPKVQYIGAYAFNGNEKVTNLQIPEATDIKENAFRKNNIINLVANKVTKIEANSFAQNNNIETIEMKGLIKLPAEAFMGMKKITSAKFEALETITSPANNSQQMGAFSAAADLSTFEAPKLKSLGAYAFFKNKNITTLNMPVLENIGYYALGYTNLEKLNSTKLVRIESYALQDTKIKELNFDNVKSIGYGALSNTKLTELIAPKLKEVQEDSFRNVKFRRINIGLESISRRALFESSKDSLEEIIANDLVSINNDSDGVFGGFSKLSRVEMPNIQIIGTYVFKNTAIRSFDFSKAKVIETLAFYNTKISGKITANNLTYLGPDAFGKTNITEVEMNELETLSSRGFDAVKTLKKATFNKLKSIEGYGSYDEIGHGAFYGTGIEEFIAPELISVGKLSFANTSKLKTFNAPKVQNIKVKAFHSSGIKTFDFSNVVNIEDYAFYQSSLEGELNLPLAVSIMLESFAYTKISGKVTANKLTDLSSNVFRETNITEVEMNELETLDSRGFDAVKTLKKATFNKLKSIKGYGSYDEIGHGAFYGTGIEEFIAPELISVGKLSFANTSKLKTFNAPKVQNIKVKAFHSSGIKTFDFSNVVNIEDYAFYQSSLEGELNLPLAVSIMLEAFAYTKISGKVTANKLTDLSSNVFRETNITEVEMNELETLDSRGFDAVKTLKKAAFNKLKSIKGYGSYDEIGHGAFYGTGIEEFIAPELISVGKLSFTNTSKLKTFNAPKVQNIKVKAFHSSGIKSFDFSNVVNIEDYAFYQSSLEGELNLPLAVSILPGAFANTKISGKVTANMVNELGSNAFQGTKITEVEMNSLETLGYSAFQNIKTLTKGTFNELLKIDEYTYNDSYGAFMGTQIKEFIAPIIEKIGSYAFYRLNKVEKVTLKVPQNVQISQNAFESSDKYQIVQE
ncbi:leucine-rich repeat protein [Mycoplasma sp. 2634B]|uniref:leucine-rich repeat protein n=1 Tax=Mycoplasma sp. 2634B TaxID=3401692 RepID=UPI003AAA4850